MLKPNEHGHITETKHITAEEAKHASLFTIGNGYMGIRGSFEEFGSLFVQGCFVRGLIDHIREFPQAHIDNDYMRHFYFDEKQLKTFESQDSGINLADFLHVKINIGDKTFYPWEGNILSWERYLDTDQGTLTRTLRWDDGKGHITRIRFKRFASFSHDHHLVLHVEIQKENHKLPVQIITGVDTVVKTVGQLKSTVEDVRFEKQTCFIKHGIGDYYQFKAGSATAISGTNIKQIDTVSQDGFYGFKLEANDADHITITKHIMIATSRDPEVKQSPLMDVVKTFINTVKDVSYEAIELEHIKAYQAAFEHLDVKIDGDKEIDGYLRYANYQTLISASRHDHVHSLSAKGLTGEKYNQFVWWDAESYQLPIFTRSYPIITKHALMYRYERLEQAKLNAQEASFRGAKYPFVSSVKGDEKVWPYARHPFMQIHINSDIAYAVIDYFRHTGDLTFMKDYGFEMLKALSLYWIDRITCDDDHCEIKTVTGTDEHHPYVDNDAYTNYLTHYVLKETKRLNESYQLSMFSKDDENTLNTIINTLKRPVANNGLIPQFDGYFDLSRSLEVVGHGAAKGFQMKESGLYQNSQIIKQPDVLLLYNYVDIDIDKRSYAQNYDYYERMCEKSSSLTYPVHAIGALDNNRYLTFYEYFKQSLILDIADLHGGSWQGLHSACLAGGWFTVYRGIFGISHRDKTLHMKPNLPPFFNRVTFKFMYQDVMVHATLDETHLRLKTDGTKVINLYINDQPHTIDQHLEVMIHG